MGDVGINGKAVLKLILKKYDIRMWEGFICFGWGSSSNDPLDYVQQDDFILMLVAFTPSKQYTFSLWDFK